jgi:phosphatidylserine/phosphatidylglycerophosphate/cardiolipin synthase-like enzyme
MTQEVRRVALLMLLMLGTLPALPATAEPDGSSTVVISALHSNGYDGENDEAVQLTHLADAPVTLDGNWALRDAGNHTWAFPAFTLPAKGRIWIANNPAGFLAQFGFSPTLSYAGALDFANHGGSVMLVRQSPELKDTANADGGEWPAGSSTTYRTMERVDAGMPDNASNWLNSSIAVPYAFNANGVPITGTPGMANSVAVPATHPATVVINEVSWAGTKGFSTQEWMELFNPLQVNVDLSGWELRIVDATPSAVALSGTIPANGLFLLARAGTFATGAAANQTASFSLSNSNVTLQLVNTNRQIVDTLVYGDGAPQAGWNGEPLQPYTVTQSIAAAGQMFMRRLHPLTGQPVPDTDTAQDWRNHRGDPLQSRAPAYPGWQLEAFSVPASGTGNLSLAIAPDSSFEFVKRALNSATGTIDIESFTFENAGIADVLVGKAASGVRVRVLLDGAPVGGLSDQARWMCGRITAADPTGRSGCWFLRADSANKIRARYAFLHTKFALIDNARLLLGSENFGARGMPDDDKADGTAGHRGVVALVDAPALVARARAIFDADIDAGNRDITRWCAACAPFGAPSAAFTPITATGGNSSTVRFGEWQASAPAPMTLFTSPENHLSGPGSIIEIMNRAGAGDEILFEQLDEPLYWGATGSNADADPNPRLQAALGAAQRGASVRVLLDGFYDDPATARSNGATAQALNDLARVNGWDLKAIRGNPTALGIHNKMILARAGGRFFSSIGSWNGTEISAKRDREMSVLIESGEAHAFLRGVFMADWHLSQPVAIPIAVRSYKPIDHLLISEVMVNPSGADEEGREWVELYNPTALPIRLDGIKVGDAAVQGSAGEGMYAFPSGAVAPAGKTIVIAQNAVAFFAEWGRNPDFELSNYNAAVPDMLFYTAWAGGTMNLSNAGDEVVLLRNDDRIFEAVTWLTGNVAGTVPFTSTLLPGHTLQRWPPNGDSDNCAIDFRDQPLPSPGQAP